MMGKADHRLHKLRTLPAASRSIVLQKTRSLRQASQGPSFRTFRKVVEMKSKRVKEKISSDAKKKQQVAIGQERKRLTMMENRKKCGGPFTSAKEVEKCLGDATITDNGKQKRLMKEHQFAKESSTTLSKRDSLFRIHVNVVLVAEGKVITALIDVVVESITPGHSNY